MCIEYFNHFRFNIEHIYGGLGDHLKRKARSLNWTLTKCASLAYSYSKNS